MQTSQCLQIEDLPDVFTPHELMSVLPIGRNAVYDLLKTQRIASVRVGQKFLVTKEALKDFLGGVQSGPVIAGTPS